MKILTHELTEWLTIQKKVKVKNEYKEIEESWVDFKRAKAKIIYRTSREREIHGQLTALRIIKFKIRYDRSIDETMLIDFFGDLYDIRSIEHDKRDATFVTVEKSKL